MITNPHSHVQNEMHAFFVFFDSTKTLEYIKLGLMSVGITVSRPLTIIADSESSLKHYVKERPDSLTKLNRKIHNISRRDQSNLCKDRRQNTYMPR